MATLEVIQLLAEDDVARSFDAVEQKDVTWPTAIGQITKDAHERRDADATTDEQNAFALASGEGEEAGWAGEIQQVSLFHVVVEETRNYSFVFVLDDNLRVIVLCRRGGNGVTALH